MLIVFEGVDCTGKSTLINAVAKALRYAGKKVLLTAALGGTPTAIKNRAYIMQKEEDKDTHKSID